MSSFDAGDAPPVPESVASTPPLPGSHERADFEPTTVLGRGGNATVRRATVRGEERTVALKEPHLGAEAPATVRERFREEAETWAALDDHPHVVTVHAWGTDPHPWLALEYMDGGSLADHVGELSLDRALWTGARVADALDHAHREGVAHLDLTPGNVLLRRPAEDAWPVPGVADWGLARALRTGAVNLEGLSPRYAAPEQFAPDRFGSPGAPTDVYQLGVVLYELLVGAAPFEGPPTALRDAVIEDPPPPPSGRNPELPAAVDGLLDRALAKAPDERYDSIAAFRDTLERLLADRTGYERPEAAARTGSGDVEATPGGSPYERALALADEGFVELTEAYFARREPAPPLEAWRRGVTLADARAGRAVERTVAEDDDRVSLGERLLDGLAAGTDNVVLGPPGSGKSTVCKRVACEWFDRGHGPVFYRESGRDGRFDDPEALARRVTATDGHALVVVEDAVRPEAEAVFAFLDRVRDVEDVTVLLDARESEWRDAGGEADPFGTDAISRGRDAVEPVYVPRPDGHEQERFVRAVEAATDRSLDMELEELRADVRQAATVDAEETRPGELFYLLHRLTALARDPLAGEEAPTTLTDAVADVYDRLADRGESVLDVGVCANVLNAAGVGVHPELLYAVVPDAPLAVDDAVEVLDGRVVFPREADWSEGTRAYPAVHEAWSTAFLAHLLDAAGERTASDRFGRVVSRVLGLADDEGAREQIREELRGDAPYVARIERAVAAWADETTEAVYELGRERPKLAPLFDDGGGDSVDLPAACSDRIVEQRPVWVGRMFLDGDYYDRAEDAFGRLPASGDGAVWRFLGLGLVALERDEYDAARDHLDRARALADRLDDRQGKARCLTGLGTAALWQGEYDRARTRYEESLAICRELDDREALTRPLDNLGHIDRIQGEYDRAQERFERSLELRREFGDRVGEGRSLTNLGIVATQRNEYDRARNYYERSLELKRELGDRKGEANTLNNLGEIDVQQGAFDRAREYFERSLELKREFGDPKGVAGGLGNVGSVDRYLGDYETAAEYLQRSLERKRELGDRQGAANTLHNLGEIARLQGEYDRARDRYERSLDIARDLDYRMLEALDFERLGRLARLRGEYVGARDRHERALDVAREIDHRNAQADALLGLGTVARLRGEHERARERYDEATATIDESGHRFVRARARFARVSLDLARGDVERADERVRRVHEEFAEMGTVHWEARTRRLRGRIAAAADGMEAAREHWRAALETFEEVGAPQDALAALELLVDTCREMGEEETAARWCGRARDLVAGAPEPTVEAHGEWVDRACPDRGDG